MLDSWKQKYDEKFLENDLKNWYTLMQFLINDLIMWIITSDKYIKQSIIIRATIEKVKQELLIISNQRRWEKIVNIKNEINIEPEALIA